MKKPLTLYFIGLTVVLLLVAPACYTLLKHPRVKRDVYYEEVSSNRCTTCHYDDELWAYHHPPNHRDVYGAHGVWDDYYLVPWWYEFYWNYDSDTPKTVPMQSRHLRPEGRKDRLGASPGGSFGPPIKTKTSETPLTIRKDDSKKETGDEKKSTKRPVRPGTKKNKKKD